MNKNTFVLGYTGVGKTTLGLKLPGNHIAGSGWLKKYSQPNFSSKKDRTEFLTDLTLKELVREPLIASNWVISQLDINKDNVIDGIRNPADFINLFDSTRDEVVWVINNNIKPMNSFEQQGLAVIRDYLMFLSEHGIIEQNQIRTVETTHHHDKTQT